MKKLLVFSLGLVLAAFLASATIAYADDVQEPFPTAGDMYCSATNGCGTLPAGGMTAPMWTTGDYIISALFDTGQPSINSLTYNFDIWDDLGGGNNETVAYWVNGVEVGTVTVNDCNYCGNNVNFNGTFNFASIGAQGGGYTLELTLQNTIPPGGGSIAFDDGGEATLTNSSGSSVPEPSSMLLFGTGALGVAGLLRRKINL